MDNPITPWYWPANTEVLACRVPWDSEYRNVVSWSSSARDAWFDQQEMFGFHTTSASYMPYNEPIALPVNVNRMMMFNYLVVMNHQPGDVPRRYYYFIKDATYVAPNTTLVNIQLDVWQTWFDGVSLGRCWVERGHVAIADHKGNVDSWANFGQSLLTLPEGLDTGGAHTIVHQENYRLHNNERPAFLVSSTIDLFADPGSVTDPKITGAGGTNFEIGVDANEMYLCEDAAGVRMLMKSVKDKPWVAQGITSITAIPSKMFQWRETMQLESHTLMGSTIYTVSGINPEAYIAGEPIMSVDNFRDHFELPQRYAHLRKFLTFPYTVIELTAYNGASVLIQPELVNANQLAIIMYSALSPAAPRLAFTTLYYGERSESGADYIPGEHLNHALVMDNFPRFSIASNQGLMYMAQNARSIAQSRNNASWAYNKASQANQLAYDQGSASVDAHLQTQLANTGALQDSTAIGNQYTAYGAGVGAISSLANGQFGSALTSAANAALSINQSQDQMSVELGRQRSVGSTARNLMQYNRDTNKAYADYAAKGDYSNAIATINASVQDSQLQAPAVHGAAGGDTLNTLSGNMVFSVRFKRLSAAAMRMIGEYWLQFGYFTQLWCTPPQDLHCMSRFTYWKMRDTHVFSEQAPEAARMTIRGILEKGVTVWRSPGDIGNIDPGINEPAYGDYLNIDNPGNGW